MNSETVAEGKNPIGDVSRPATNPPNQPAHLRLFIAINLPDDIKGELERTQAKFQRGSPKSHIRWTNQEQFHLTLKFLGNVETNRTERLLDAVRDACKGFTPLEMRTAKLGAFPGWSRPRVIWVGVEDAGQQLLPLQRAIETASQPFAAEEPDKTFTAHITLARIKSLSRQHAGALAMVASGLAEQVFGTWTATAVDIMRSELSQSGAKHTVLATVHLEERAATGKK